MKISIDGQLVELALELERYYSGDLEYCDSAKWLEDTKRLNRQLANQVRHLILEQVARGKLPDAITGKKGATNEK